MIFGSQKRDPCKSFYMVPNEIMRLGLSVGEIAVYNYLMYCEDHNTYQCYPSYRKMGEALGLTRKTVMKHVRSLEDRCLISTEPTTVTLKSGKKQNGNLLYTIRPIQEAVDHFNAEQLRKAEQEMARLNVIRKLEEYDRKHGSIDGKRSSLFEAGESNDAENVAVAYHIGRQSRPRNGMVEPFVKRFNHLIVGD